MIMLLQILICVFFRNIHSAKPVVSQKIILSDFKTLFTLKSFLGIISDVRIGNVLIFIFFDISIIMSPSAMALLSAAIPSFSHRLSFDPRFLLLRPGLRFLTSSERCSYVRRVAVRKFWSFRVLLKIAAKRVRKYFGQRNQRKAQN